MQSRYYDPVLHRYLSPDSVFDYDVGMPGYNLYAYCGNTPVYRIDVNGRDSSPAGGEQDYLENKLIDGAGNGVSLRTAPGNHSGTSGVNGGTSGMGGYGSGYGGDSLTTGRRKDEEKNHNSKTSGVTHNIGETSPKKVKIPNGFYTQIDSNGEIHSYTMYNKDGNQLLRIDFKGRPHAGVLPHIHVYGYNSYGQQNCSKIYDMNFNLIG